MSGALGGEDGTETFPGTRRSGLGARLDTGVVVALVVALARPERLLVDILGVSRDTAVACGESLAVTLGVPRLLPATDLVGDVERGIIDDEAGLGLALAL
jgi:hypothetical protein